MRCTILAVVILAAVARGEKKWVPDPLCPFPSYDITRYQYEGDCAIFWECFQGTRYVMTCPSGLQYNEQYERCDAPEIAKCNPSKQITYEVFPHDDYTPPEGNNAETDEEWSPDVLCPYPSEILTFYPNPANCAQFFECWQGNKYVFDCPANQYWNIKQSYCDYLENVDCSLNTLPYEPQPEPEPQPDPEPQQPEPEPQPGQDSQPEPDQDGQPDPLCPYPSHEISFYPYALNCAQFLECYEGKKYLMDCPSGLYWNVDANVCDYKENVDCSRNSAPIAVPIPPEQVALPQQPDDKPAQDDTQGKASQGSLLESLCPNPSHELLFLPYALDCSLFVQCYEGSAYLMSCASGLYWNVDANICDYKENVDCARNSGAIALPPEQLSPVVVPSDPETDETQDQPADSQNPDQPQEWKPDPLCPYPSHEISFYPYSLDCSQFLECYEGNKYLMSCPSGLVWNIDASVCDYKENVDCSRNSASIAVPIPPEQVALPQQPEDQPENPQETPDFTQEWKPDPLCPYPSHVISFFPNALDCSQFLECYEGNKFLMSCPNGLVWNIDANVCDYKENVDCSRNSAPIAVPIPPEQVALPQQPEDQPGNPQETPDSTQEWKPDPLCPYPSHEISFYPYSLDCSLFLECYEGNKYVMSCPNGLVWNIDANVCDYKENVDCSRNTGSVAIPIPPEQVVLPQQPDQPSSNPQETPDTPQEWKPDPLCPYPSHELSFFPNLLDCATFYECYEGNKYLLKCPSNLVWNIKLSVCDYRDNVDCNRIVPPHPHPLPVPDPVPQPEPEPQPEPQPLPEPIPQPDPQPAPAPLPQPDLLCIGEFDGVYHANPIDCHKFYECLAGKAIEAVCPSNLLWHEEIHTCDYPENVKCAQYF